MRRRFPTPLFVLLSCATLSACLLTGCEKRVVGMENRWTRGGKPKIVRENPVAQKTERDGALEQIGELLFGWTKHFEPEDPIVGYKPPSHAPYAQDASRFNDRE